MSKVQCDKPEMVSTRDLLKQYANGDLTVKPTLNVSTSVGFMIGQIAEGTVGVIQSLPIVGDVIFGASQGYQYAKTQRSLKEELKEAQALLGRIAKEQAGSARQSPERRGSPSEHPNFVTATA